MFLATGPIPRATLQLGFPHMPSHQGLKYLLIITDMFFKWAEVFLTIIIAIFSPVKIESGHICQVINLCSTKLHLSTQQHTEKSRLNKTSGTRVHYFSKIRRYSADSCAFQLHGLQPRALALYPAQPQIPASVSQRSLRPRGRLASGLRVTG